MTYLQKKILTLGSLFDGSGAFPLAGMLAGIRPVWSSEIEPFCIRVTTKRMPFIQHLGDISKLNGASLEPVDIITFGSPCQDMSIAGKRAGLDGKRSNLFYQAVRIINEMRRATNGKYPKFAVWENVTGAYSSNGGEDFRAVLESFCKVKDESAVIPRPEKWGKSGEILGKNYSVAWRTLDAQYWGVPQRRRRCYLVADFDGGRAGKILFESEGVSGYSPEGFRTWQETARCAENGSRTAGKGLVFENHGQDCRYRESSEISPTILANGGTGGNNQPFVVTFSQETYSRYAENSKSASLKASGGTTGGGSEALVCPTGAKNIVRRLIPAECALLQGMPGWWCSGLETENPTEQEIDRWTEIFIEHGKPKTRKFIEKWLKNPHSDSAEYRMWGNAIALPCGYFVLSGISYYTQYIE